MVFILILLGAGIHTQQSLGYQSILLIFQIIVLHAKDSVDIHVGGDGLWVNLFAVKRARMAGVIWFKSMATAIAISATNHELVIF